MSKIIDIEDKGNVIRVYFGEDDCFDYYGDDWDDIPYEHNAGGVYDEFVTSTADIFIPYDYNVYPVYHNYCNSPWCKNDLKNKVIAAYTIYKTNKDSWDEQHVMNLFFETSKSDLLTELIKNGFEYKLGEETFSE
jgi:hypothetical protein